MWISKTVFDFLTQRTEDLVVVREELSQRTAEVRDLTESLATAKANFNWLASRVNALEVERALLLEKVTGVKTTVPEIVRPVSTASIDSLLNSDIFNDMGDDKARTLGLPTYS